MNDNRYKFIFTLTIEIKLKLIMINVFYRNSNYKTLPKNNI